MTAEGHLANEKNECVKHTYAKNWRLFGVKKSVYIPIPLFSGTVVVLIKGQRWMTKANRAIWMSIVRLPSLRESF